jgi:hypothetical protein
MARLVRYRGDTRPIKLAIADEGEPMSLSGCKLWFTVKRHEGQPESEALFQKHSESGGITIVNASAPQGDPDRGRALVALLAADTAAVERTTEYIYDVQMRDASGDIGTVDKGTIVIEADVTRSTV